MYDKVEKSSLHGNTTFLVSSVWKETQLITGYDFCLFLFYTILECLLISFKFLYQMSHFYKMLYLKTPQKITDNYH